MTILVFVATLPAAAYVLWRAGSLSARLLPDLPGNVRWWAAAAVGAWWCLHPGLLLVGGWLGTRSLWSGGIVYDAALLYPFWLGVCFFGQVVGYLLAVDALSVAARFLHRESWLVWRDVQAPVLLACLALALLYVCLVVYSDTTKVRVRRTTHVVPGLPEDLDSLRVVHVADLQADTRTKETRIARYVDAVNRLEPDLVLFSGDLVTRGTRHVDAGASALGRFKARFGVYACLGDHDIWADPDLIINRLTDNNVAIAHNKHVSVKVDTSTVCVSLLTNAYSSRPDLAAFNRARPESHLPILVTHQPTHGAISAAGEAGYRLVAAGHTHGGQIVVGWFGFEISPSMRETRYRSGIYTVDDMMVSVNNGLGLTLAPIRYRAPAEVTLIRMIGSKGEGSST